MARLSAIRKEAQRKRKAARERFKVAKGAASWYERQLRQVGKQIGTIVEGFAPGGVLKDMAGLRNALGKYSELLKPWAQSVARRMIAEADQRDQRKWQQAATEIGQTLRRELQTTPIGATYEALMQTQVMLITSLPLDAAERVHRLTLQAMVESRRANEVAVEIYKSGHVSVSRAMLIARTEVARTASVLCESRARYVGSEGYIWRTSGDSDVRDLHRKLEGKFIPWSEPPVAGENGERAHAGQIYNCFPGSTKISTDCGIRHVWRVPYEGKLVNITVAGQLIAATPNHPILTRRGWVAASTIEQGDDVVCMRQQHANVVKHYEDYMLPTLEEVFNASVPALRKMPGVTLESNFHGDVFYGDVNEVASDFLLTLNTEAISLEEFRKFVLSRPNSRVASYEFLEVKKTLFPGVRNVSTILLRSATRGNELVSFGLRSHGNTCTLESVLNCCRSALVAFGQGRRSQSVQILLDELRVRDIRSLIVPSRRMAFNVNADRLELLAKNVSRASDRGSGFLNVLPSTYEFSSVEDVSLSDHSGHVYTLESDTGWFGVTTAGIISKNCRCYPEPVLPDVIA